MAIPECITVGRIVEANGQGMTSDPVAKDGLPMKTQDHYYILGIDRNASGAEIKSAYRTLAQRFHPDVTDDPDGECKFKAVAEAYRTLKHAETRTVYDLHALSLHGYGGFAQIDDPLRVWYALFLWSAWRWYYPR